MQTENINIYKKARSNTHYTQEYAAELISVSVESLKAYESGRTVPPNDVVRQMMMVYGTPWLAPKHIFNNSSELIHGCLPQIETNKDLTETALGLLKEFNDFDKLKNDFIAIVSDGRITPDEVDKFKAIKKELADIHAAILEIMYAKEKE